jgi:DNA-binding HxlR family transcriptional regulator
VVDFRYAQFCPLTRAVEILGERWTILILRELFPGAKRFSDLKSALNGVSPSVLADRLARLEERGIVAKRVVPPAVIPIYELDEAGRALAPVLADLTRWGMRFLGTPGPGDRIRPEWLLLGLQTFARTHATEAIGAKLCISDDDESIDIYVRGGDSGTTASVSAMPFDVTLRAAPVDMLMFASGILAPDAGSALQCDGDAAVARRIPALFDFRPADAAATRPPSDLSVPPRPGRRARRRPSPAADRGRYKTVSIPVGGESS